MRRPAVAHIIFRMYFEEIECRQKIARPTATVFWGRDVAIVSGLQADPNALRRDRFDEARSHQRLRFGIVAVERLKAAFAAARQID